jgi:spore coat protein U-like protein
MFAVIASLGLGPTTAWAAHCEISASGVIFGVYDQASGRPTDVAGTVTVTCQSGNQIVHLEIALSSGANSGGSFANRRMTNGNAFLRYQLYTNPAHTTVWGDGTGGTITVKDSYDCKPPCQNVTRQFTVYGRLPALQSPGSGNYIDIVQATVTFD